MDKLQQEIMEIIEPYTDKTLSEGCVIITRTNQAWDYSFSDDMIWDDSTCSRINDKWEFKDMDNDYRTIDDWNYIYSELTGKWELNGKTWEYPMYTLKVLWHYDTTAVLKYIEDKWWEYRNLHWKIRIQHWHITEEVEWVNLTSVNVIWNLEIKPLHLYTKQENILLLELLKTLWKNQ